MQVQANQHLINQEREEKQMSYHLYYLYSCLATGDRPKENA